MVQWLERATDNRVVTVSNTTEAVFKLLQFPLPMSFGRDTIAVGPFLPCAIIFIIDRSEVKYLTEVVNV